MVGEGENQRLIVGLGNPGKKYEMTRHNIGFLILEAFAKLHGWPFKGERRFHAKLAKGSLRGKALQLILPETFMNESGRSVRRASDFFKIPPEAIIVVTDDVELPFGMLRVRPSGSAGGHNGLKSIRKELGCDKFVRLRVGVGEKNHPEQDLADHVLGRFNAEELRQLPASIEAAVATLERMIDEDISLVMNAVNKKVKRNELPKGEQEKSDESREA